MAEWKVEPSWKKSCIEKQYIVKGDNYIVVETGWRWGEFIVYTDDDNPPKLEAGVDIYNCGYESELISTSDGCWEEIDYDVDEETREWLDNFFEEGNRYYDLEDHGWTFDDCEMIIDCDLIITKVNEDGSEGETITTGDSEEAEKVVTEVNTLNPTAAWPFSNASTDEETK